MWFYCLLVNRRSCMLPWSIENFIRTEILSILEFYSGPIKVFIRCRRIRPFFAQHFTLGIFSRIWYSFCPLLTKVFRLVDLFHIKYTWLLCWEKNSVATDQLCGAMEADLEPHALSIYKSMVPYATSYMTFEANLSL